MATPAAPPRRMNLVPRVLSGAVLIAIVVAGLLVGGLALDILIGVAAALGAVEAHGLLQKVPRVRPVLPPIVALAVTLALLAAWPDLATALIVVLAALVAAGLATVAAHLFVAPVPRSPLGWLASLGAGVYLGLGLGSLLAIARYRGGDERFDLALIAVTVGAVVACDTMAYFTGFAFGRHRFFPKISPSKTVEGAIGGLAGAVIVGVAAGIPAVGLAAPVAVGFGLLTAAAAQAGDLAESALKRRAGVKDSGRLIPGHGGLLDRLDSLLLVGPVAWLYLRLCGVA